MIKTIITLSILLGCFISVSAQQGISINSDGSQPDNSAVLDVTSSSKGFLTPRMTEVQKNAINNPAISLLVFQTDGTVPGFYYYTCYGWQQLGSPPTGSGCAMVATINVDNNVSINGGSDGQATVTQTCGTGPITYLWSDNQVTQTAVGLSAGSYCVTLTDVNSCTFTDCVNITEPGGPPSYTIGDFAEGGVVFYILQNGDPGYDANVQHGLACAIADQSSGSGISWGNPGGPNLATGATGTAIGTGQSNTTAIVTIQGVGSYAAQLCNNLSLGGYSDWFLPSKLELNQMIVNKVAIDATALANGGSGFGGLSYWCSTEYYSYDMAWNQSFVTGLHYGGYKYFTFIVRAVRSF